MEEEEEEDLRGRRNEESLPLFVVYGGASIKKRNQWRKIEDSKVGDSSLILVDSSLSVCMLIFLSF